MHCVRGDLCPYRATVVPCIFFSLSSSSSTNFPSFYNRCDMTESSTGGPGRNDECTDASAFDGESPNTETTELRGRAND